MKLSKKSIEWAFAHLLKENDTDLFPEPLEIEIMHCFDRGIFAQRFDHALGSSPLTAFTAALGAVM